MRWTGEYYTPDGVANGHGAAIHVALVHIEAEGLLGSDGHAAERLVDLPPRNVLNLQPRLRASVQRE